MTKNSKRAGGFTLVELLVVIAIIALLVGILLPAVNRARKNAIQLKDSTQLRNVMQAFLQYAQTNKEKYPLPSEVDNRGDVIDLTNTARKEMNTTGAICSIIIFQQLITPEICKSPAEVGRVDVMDDYKYEMNAQMGDTGTKNPARAAWDPRFKGTPKDKASGNPYAGLLSGLAEMEDGVGHNSYAHACYASGRSTAWTNTVSASTPVWATRGPVYKNVANPGDAWELDDQSNRAQGLESPTIEIFGNGGRWAGNVTYADGHVSYTSDPDPQDVTYTQQQASGKVSYRDNLFFDEVTEGTTTGLPVGSRRNAYIRQWWKGIPTDQGVTTDNMKEGNGGYIYVDGDKLQ
jgi:prepilin-type N-terminal cleavage/methylation domain-containing protein/prepilin-type processing-associated H-X9-DG protein